MYRMEKYDLFSYDTKETFVFYSEKVCPTFTK